MHAAGGQPAAQGLLSPAVPSLLEAGLLPVEELADLAWRESVRPRPVYQAHKWFARRFGTAFRALLTAAALPADGDFWPTYYAGLKAHALEAGELSEADRRRQRWRGGAALRGAHASCPTADSVPASSFTFLPT
jgi:hypothetical protein